jgi:hypothetical protein
MLLNHASVTNGTGTVGRTTMCGQSGPRQQCVILMGLAELMFWGGAGAGLGGSIGGAVGAVLGAIIGIIVAIL